MVVVEGVEYISASEVAKELMISRQTLWRWRQSEKIPCGRLYRDHQLIFTLSEMESIREYANRLAPSLTKDVTQKTLF